MGRTGSLYAYQQYGVTPDILTTAKALGGGFPIGAMLATADVAASFGVGTHGSTYGGNPLACAVAARVFSLINTPETLDGVGRRRRRLDEGLAEQNRRYPLFRTFRGRGLLIGAVLRDEYAGHARDVMRAALDEGLMLLMAGGDVVRLAPSLVIPDADIDEGIERLGAAMQRMYRQAA
jgi:acetylornithine/succinyldiaminopimelate/putrescine aminotransferase